ncbi:hypothetical protein PPYR_11345 [Photinus pyralis]|uniref:Osiris 8 n=2 Tax=Photinus pyralis TaxID=7054 RepID=A0A5N4AB01_PHOPY|nr:uncharacterized protein LOC116176605 [Photinus pyralis]KAB0794506.1 hypothetical protein PPYR_11345 [Photinus pyralis]
MILKCFVVTLLVSIAWARTASTNLNDIPHEARSEASTSSHFGDLHYAYKVYRECAASELSPCLKLKLISAMDRALRAFNDVSVMEGVTFVKDSKAPEPAAPKTVAEIEASLPRELNRDDALNQLIVERFVNFFDTHSLQIKLPSASDIKRSLSDEGRKKKNRMGGLLLLPLILVGTLVPIALGGLALLAGKALIVAKIALVLAGVLGLKKLFGGHGGGSDSGHEVVVAGSGGAGGSTWARSYDKEQAQKIAYSAYAPHSSR